MAETEGKTRVPISISVRNTARDAKLKNETWDEYMLRCADSEHKPVTVSDVRALLDERQGEKVGGAVDVDALTAQIVQALGKIDVDVDASVNMDELAKKVGSGLEMSSYRGARDAIEEATR
jgi:hypothetical protein